MTVGSPVYLTRNGHGAYSIRDIKDEENFQKAEAMRDMDAVWDGVYETSKNYDIADRYIEEFADALQPRPYKVAFTPRLFQKSFFYFLKVFFFFRIGNLHCNHLFIWQI